MPTTYASALKDLNSFLLTLEPIAKKMEEHHSVCLKPISDYERVLKSTSLLKERLIHPYSKNKQFLRLRKKILPYLDFEKTPFHKDFFCMSSSGFSYEKKFIPLTQAKLDLQLLKLHEINPRELDGYATLHTMYYRVINNMRQSVVYLHEKMAAIYHDQLEPPKKRFFSFGRR